MNILLIGSGGRENALAWKIKQSNLCHELYIAPGNPGTEALGTNILLSISDFEAIEKTVVENQINMVVVGPELPLSLGLRDFFRSKPHLQNIPFIGPDTKGAQLESSKAFSKGFMSKYGIPTAAYKNFDRTELTQLLHYLSQHKMPVVLKADGLAEGKGVLIAQNHDEAIEAVDILWNQNKFGHSADTIVVEEFLTGVELSVFALTDANHYIILPEAKDYKRIGEQDTGPNTGGMGAISPVPFYEGEFETKVIEHIINPTIKGLKREDIDYQGFIFFGLINVNGNPYVIEYNCRLGDPETEAILLRLESDIVSHFMACHNRSLKNETISISSQKAATVILASAGYPDQYEKNKVIHLPSDTQQSKIFHAGTKSENQQLLTNGGRVLAISSLATTYEEALKLTFDTINQINFEGKTFRNDIGYEFLK